MASGQQLKEQQQTIRLPLYAADDQRLLNIDSSDGRDLHDQILVNCFPVISEDPTGQSQRNVHIQSRLGWLDPETGSTSGVITYPTAAYTLAVCNIEAITDEIIMAVNDGTDIKIILYSPAANTYELLGTIARSTNYSSNCFVHLSEVSIGAGNTPAVGIVLSDTSTQKSDGWFILSASGSFSGQTFSGASTAGGGDGLPIADVDFPPNNSMVIVGPFVQLNENIYIMTENGYIYNTELDGSGDSQFLTWNTSGYVSTSWSGDKGLGLARYKHHIVAFGTNSMEFYSDEGIAAPRAPIAPMLQAHIRMGANNQYSYKTVDDTLYWLMVSSTGVLALYKLDGYTPVKLSQSSYSVALGNRSYRTNLQVVSMFGVTHLVTNQPVDAHYWFDDGIENGDVPANTYGFGVLCYALDSKSWWVWLEEDTTPDPFLGSGHPYFLFCTTTTAAGQLVRFSWKQARDLGSGYSYGIHGRSAPLYSDNTTTAGYDQYRLNSDATIDSFRMPVMISTPFYDFGNNQRKFIRSVELICDQIIPQSSASAPLPAFWSEGLTLNLGVSRQDHKGYNENPEIIRATPIFIEKVGTLTTSLVANPETTVETDITTDSTLAQTGTIIIENDAGTLIQVNYTAWTGSTLMTFTIPNTNFDAVNATLGNAVYIRNLKDPTWYRYKWHNLGATRRARFFIELNTFTPIRFQALELNIAQGTH